MERIDKENAKGTAQDRLYSEALLVFAGVMFLARFSAGPLRLADSGVVIPVLFVWVPCVLLALGRVDDETLGIACFDFRRAFTALLCSIPLLALYALVFTKIIAPFFPYSGPAPSTSGFVLIRIAREAAFVGLPEEFFFRGYIQGMLVRAQGDRAEKIPLKAIVISAALFALAHLFLKEDIRSLETFFPGLLFGWIRWKSSGIWTGSFIHGACNVLHRFLQHA